MRKTKIICTIGPASESEEKLRELMLAGMNVARFNFSHGSHKEQLVKYNRVLKVRKELGLPVATLLDTKGPEIRLRDFEGGKVELVSGQQFVLTTEEIMGTAERATISYKNLKNDINVGKTILIDDGLIEMTVEEIKGEDIVCKVINGGFVSNHKGVNVPGAILSMPYISEVDLADIVFGVEHGFDFIAASFVRTREDIQEVRKIVEDRGSKIKIIAKIEKPQALENLEEIVKTFDGVMAARGDMAVECPLEEVPLATKRIIELARQYAKPVIVATEVLGSMVNSPVPTRAEASDCANAILDGSDATMTSNETAVGKYPDVTVATMARISGYATDHGFDRIPELKNLDMSSTGAVSSAAVDLADKLNAKAIVAYTQTGATVHRVSRERPAAPIYGLTSNEHTYHWLALSWGTEAFLLKEDYHDKSRKDLMVYTDKVLKDAGKVADGDKIVILSSAQGDHQPGRTDSIYVHTVGACD